VTKPLSRTCWLQNFKAQRALLIGVAGKVAVSASRISRPGLRDVLQHPNVHGTDHVERGATTQHGRRRRMAEQTGALRRGIDPGLATALRTMLVTTPELVSGRIGAFKRKGVSNCQFAAQRLVLLCRPR
jgi:hypothetical protein